MRLSVCEQSRVIEMAWKDRTPFEAIEQLYGLSESQVITFMRRNLKPSSFKLWRQRVNGRATKHKKLRHPAVSRGYCPTQYKSRVK
ncbi:TIGR03643 family protein [Pseudoalteromonas sp. S16_S37]|uniref:TIGR03643 family protein n=1 Tax=Pseudoalteromonas sp. S16_S37 TaxID=2720228 RepID=UPI0016816A0C|nr:TIGR03643 family protein [Pseudoalteromonas sp. S16_S37]MBD1584530.1 TIGR03643 family protein [Pseudoalteromonas sp. S16_S37]